MTVPSDRREAKSACGCYVEWNGSEWRVSASSFLCDHKQGDRIDGAPPADRGDDRHQARERAEYALLPDHRGHRNEEAAALAHDVLALVAERDRYENALREARKFVRLGGPLSADDRVELVAMLSKALWSSRRSEA